MKIKRLIYISTTLILGLSGLVFLFIPKAAAYSQTRMIDDGIFDNSNSMSESAIRSFINSRPGTCLVNSGAIFPEPKDYYNYGPNNVDAARVIYIAAQTWGLNPQVILTTLQKEQTLLTDNDCFDPQGVPSLPKAMGYLCPEGGTCPAPSASGFEKQVMKGSWQFKFNKERAEGNVNWNGDGNIDYSDPYIYTAGNRQDYVGAPVIYHDGYFYIDGVLTYMENGGTASLYRYTRHWPQSFGSIFTSWFGSPTNVCGSDLPDAAATSNAHRPGDYSGDGRTDAAVFRPSDGCWHVRAVGDVQYGQSGDIPVPADYNGDGKTDIAIYRPSDGGWRIRGVGDFPYGQENDIPVPADYNGDGKTDAAVYRPSQTQGGENMWHIRGVGDFAFGHTGDIPVPADYNGDGKADIAVFRAGNGDWHIRGVGDYTAYGQFGDIPVPGDYNGDGHAEAAVFRPTDGGWRIRGVGDSPHGWSTDIPVPAYYSASNHVDIAIYRPSDGGWRVRAYGDFPHGNSTDIPAVQTLSAYLLYTHYLIPSY